MTFREVCIDIALTIDELGGKGLKMAQRRIVCCWPSIAGSIKRRRGMLLM